MGYLLPVTPYAYNNYHKRTINHAANIYYIERKYRVIFQEMKREQESETKSLREAYLKAKYPIVKSKPHKLDIMLAKPMEQHKGRQINLHV